MSLVDENQTWPIIEKNAEKYHLVGREVETKIIE